MPVLSRLAALWRNLVHRTRLERVIENEVAQRPGVTVFPSRIYDTAPLANVSHCLSSPLSIPRRNHWTRCSALPWVKPSGTT